MDKKVLSRDTKLINNEVEFYHTIEIEYGYEVEFINHLTKRKNHVYMLESDLLDYQEHFKDDVKVSDEKVVFYHVRVGVLNINYLHAGHYLRTIIRTVKNKKRILYMSEIYYNKDLSYDFFGGKYGLYLDSGYDF